MQEEGQGDGRQPRVDLPGVDKDKKDQIKGENVALATGRTGKERNVDDYKVTLTISCNWCTATSGLRR